MVIDLQLYKHSYRPIFTGYLNGKQIKILLDTGARGIIFVGDNSTFNSYGLKQLCKTCKVTGFGGDGEDSILYEGKLVINRINRLLIFDGIEIAKSSRKVYRDFDLVIPMSLFNLFNIKISGEKNDRWLQIDTKRDDKITYKPQHSKYGEIIDILCQKDTDKDELKVEQYDSNLFNIR